jgi:hypothetical protein
VFFVFLAPGLLGEINRTQTHKTMSRNTAVFQVFVASPSDVAEERRLLEGVIRQLNQIWSRSIGITFELLKWETDVHPSFSTDPQAAINEQIGFEYDVFIGIFWGRLGTPTPRAASGTMEEFDRAYSRFMLNKTSPEIMIYFKDVGIAPSKTDTDQLQKVNKFRESLAIKGGLYSMFEDHAGFESSLRSHLSALAQKFSTQQRNLVSGFSSNREQPTQEIQLLPEEDDYGILDYTEIYTARLEEVSSAMTSIGEATIRLGEQLSQRTAEMQTVDKSSVKDMRRNAKRAADDMSNFADVVKIQVAVMTSGREVAFDALSNALSLQTDFTTDKYDLQSLRESLVSLIENADYARHGTSDMRASVGSLPRITKELNVAKRAVVTQLDLVITEFDKVTFTLKNITEAVDRMLGASGDAELPI